jgi:hypothetical protein
VAKTRQGSAPGFTLLEALLALALVGVALLLDLGLQAQARAIEARLAIEADLLRRAEAVVESVRAGAHPLASGPVDGALAWPVSADPALRMSLLVEPTEVPGLCRVEVRGSMPWRVGSPLPQGAGEGAVHDVRVDTLIWRPGASCR